MQLENANIKDIDDTALYDESIGLILRQKRESLGLSIEDVSVVTKIRQPFILALENNAFQELPGSVYVSGFLKNYAEVLNLPADYLLSMYSANVLKDEVKSTYKIYLPRQKRRFLNLKIMFITLTIMLFAVLLKPIYIGFFDNMSLDSSLEGLDIGKKMQSKGIDIAPYAQLLSERELDSTIDFILEDGDDDDLDSSED